MARVCAVFGLPAALQRRVGALLDRAAPGSSLAATRLDELLEALQVILHLAVHEPQRVADALKEPFGIVLEGEGNARLVIAEAMEINHAAVHVARRAGPGDAIVGNLLSDARVPLLLFAADVGAPAQALVVDLAHFLDAVHELREQLELRPLVV